MKQHFVLDVLVKFFSDRKPLFVKLKLLSNLIAKKVTGL